MSGHRADPIKDWRDVSQYPDSSLEWKWWPWEFLRRNGDYQALWRRCLRWYEEEKDSLPRLTKDGPPMVPGPVREQDPDGERFALTYGRIREWARSWALHNGVVNPKTDRPYFFGSP